MNVSALSLDSSLVKWRSHSMAPSPCEWVRSWDRAPTGFGMDLGVRWRCERGNSNDIDSDWNVGGWRKMNVFQEPQSAFLRARAMSETWRFLPRGKEVKGLWTATSCPSLRAFGSFSELGSAIRTATSCTRRTMDSEAGPSWSR